MPRHTEPERLELVEQLLLAGANKAQINKVVQERFNCDRRSVDRYIETIEGRWNKAGMSTEQAMLLNAYRRAMAEGKITPAIAAIEKLAKSKLGDNREVYDALPAQPEDSLGGVQWAQRALLVAMKDAMRDPELTPAQRRDEIRRTSRCIAALVPQTDLYETRRMIIEDAGKLDVEEDPDLDAAEGRQRPIRAEAARAERDE